MKTVQETYEAYKLMPNLQLHQLRVAAVGKTICDNFSGEIDSHAVILACLFHDMGNIIKFDLDYFPQFLEPEGKAYWQSVKDEYVAKYGTDEHVASNEIAEEIGLSERVRYLIDEVRFSRLVSARDGDDFEAKIVKYGDLRVSPFAIVSMTDRLAEGKKRYEKRKSYDTQEGAMYYNKNVEAAYEIERQLFERCLIKPEDIDDETTRTLVEELRQYPVSQ